MSVETMSVREFEKRVDALARSGLSVEAARLVLVEGKGIREAARTVKIDPTVTSRMVSQIRNVGVCKCCGQAVQAK